MSGGQEVPATSDFINETVATLHKTLIDKNQDYGDAVSRRPLLAKRVMPREAILVRMSDKISRLENLLQSDAEPKVLESIDETMLDLAGYAILYLVQGRKELSR